jgi:predicted nuclease with TOPRIM domain
MLKHSDIKSKGLILTQSEAQLIHSKINGIAQGHITDGIVYPAMGTTDEKPKPDLLKEYYAELQVKNNALLKENAELREELKQNNEIKLQNQTINGNLAAENVKLNDEIKELNYQLAEARAIKVNGDEPVEKIKGKPGPKPKESENNS